MRIPSIVLLMGLGFLYISCSDQIEDLSVPAFELDSAKLSTSEIDLNYQIKKSTTLNSYMNDVYDLYESQTSSSSITYMSTSDLGLQKNDILFGLKNDSIVSKTTKLDIRKVYFVASVMTHTKDTSRFFNDKYMTSLDTTKPTLNVELVALDNQNKTTVLAKSVSTPSFEPIVNFSTEKQTSWGTNTLNLKTDKFKYQFEKDSLVNSIHIELGNYEQFISQYITTQKRTDTTYAHIFSGLSKTVFGLKATSGNSSVMLNLKSFAIKIHYYNKTGKKEPLVKSIATSQFQRENRTTPYSRYTTKSTPKLLLSQGMNYVDLEQFETVAQKQIETLLKKQREDNLLISAGLKIKMSNPYTNSFLTPPPLTLRNFTTEGEFPDALIDQNANALGTFVDFDPKTNLYTINLTATLLAYINNRTALPKKLRLSLPYTNHIKNQFDTYPVDKFHTINSVNVENITFSIEYLDKLKSYKN